MPTPEFLQLILVAAVAGYVGYLLGRASAGQTGATSLPSPLPGPETDAGTSQPRTSSTADANRPQAPERTPPRRTSAPPPAAAGLMKRDD
ncbi:MAG: hypothetical protein MUC37_09925 [Hyphomicrobium sp.]|nr:hypothetical protein [Hyphomicrobium sp.]